MKKGRVQHKIAVVTGGASGIGLATASLFRKEGSEVIIADIKKPSISTDMIFIGLDISSKKDWDGLFSEIKRLFGRLDILVNCAGINGLTFDAPHDPEHISIDQFRRVMSVNAEGTLMGCQHGIAVMKGHGGSIVNVDSLSSLLVLPGMFDYAASKAVIRYMTKAFALDCATKGYNIRCNSVTPGAIYTPLWDTIFSKCANKAEKEREVREKIPLKTWGQPEDVAYAILYLASDEARHVTGADIVVDGGQCIKGQATRGQ